MVGLGGTGHQQPRRVDHLAAARAEYAQVRGVGLQHMACTVCDTYCHTICHTLSHIYDSVAHAIASLVFQAFGVPEEAVQSMLSIIEEMKYFL